jgi:putative ABC transport system permease protein
MSVGAGGAVEPKRLAPLLDENSALGRTVDAVTIYGSSSVDAGDVTLALIVMQPLKGSLGPTVLSGRLPNGPSEIALGRVAARHLHAGVGDDVAVRTERGRRHLAVSGIVIPSSSGGIELNQDAGAIDQPAATSLGVESDTSVAAVRLAPDAPADARARIAKALGLEDSGVESRPGAILNLERVRGIPALVALLVAVLAIATLGHQVVTAVRRRSPDLAVLRALGVSRRGLGRIVHWQASLTILAVLVVGVPLGVALGSIVYRPFPDRIGAALTTEIPWWQIAAVGAGLLVLGNIIVAIPARRARRLTPNSALARS